MTAKKKFSSADRVVKRLIENRYGVRQGEDEWMREKERDRCRTPCGVDGKILGKRQTDRKTSFTNADIATTPKTWFETCSHAGPFPWSDTGKKYENKTNSSSLTSFSAGTKTVQNSIRRDRNENGFPTVPTEQQTTCLLHSDLPGLVTRLGSTQGEGRAERKADWNARRETQAEVTGFSRAFLRSLHGHSRSRLPRF